MPKYYYGHESCGPQAPLAPDLTQTPGATAGPPIKASIAQCCLQRSPNDNFGDDFGMAVECLCQVELTLSSVVQGVCELHFPDWIVIAVHVGCPSGVMEGVV